MRVNTTFFDTVNSSINYLTEKNPRRLHRQNRNVRHRSFLKLETELKLKELETDV